MTNVRTKTLKDFFGRKVLALLGTAAVTWVSPAFANNIPGVGIVIKCYCSPPPNGKSIWAIVVPTDKDGVVRLSGLVPAQYEVKLSGNSNPTRINVEKDGKLAFVAQRDVKGGPNVKSADPRARRALPFMQQWVEPIAFGEESGSGTIIAIVAAKVVDLNTASADEIARITGTSMQSSVHIVVQREKGGRYSSIENFAQRNCRTMEIDMNRGGIKISDLTIMMPVAGAASSGLQCSPGGGDEFSLYGKKHNYVGHVTLLR